MPTSEGFVEKESWKVMMWLTVNHRECDFKNETWTSGSSILEERKAPYSQVNMVKPQEFKENSVF